MFRALEAPSRQDRAVRIGDLIIDLSSRTVLRGGTASGATDSARRAHEEGLTEKGPIGPANQAIRQCLDDFATERRARQRLTSLLAALVPDVIFEIQGRLFDEMYGNKMG